MKFLGKQHKLSTKPEMPKHPLCLVWDFWDFGAITLFCTVMAWNFWENAAYATLCPMFGTEFLGKCYIYTFGFQTRSCQKYTLFWHEILGILVQSRYFVQSWHGIFGKMPQRHILSSTGSASLFRISFRHGILRKIPQLLSLILYYPALV